MLIQKFLQQIAMALSIADHKHFKIRRLAFCLLGIAEICNDSLDAL